MECTALAGSDGGSGVYVFDLLLLPCKMSFPYVMAAVELVSASSLNLALRCYSAQDHKENEDNCRRCYCGDDAAPRLRTRGKIFEWKMTLNLLPKMM